MIAVLAALSIESPAFGQSKATCAAYMKADASFRAIPVVRDWGVLIEIERENQDLERKAALNRALMAVGQTPMFKLALKQLRREQRKAYRESVVTDRQAMFDLVMADIERCKERIGYENWPNTRNPKGMRR